MTRILWRLLSYWRPHWPAVVFAYTGLVVSTGFALGNPAVVRYAIDSGISGGSKPALLAAAGMILGLQAGRGVFGYFQTYLSEYLSQHVAYDLRNDLYSRIQSLSTESLDASRGERRP